MVALVRQTNDESLASRYDLRMTDRTRARDLAKEYAKKGDATGWFEQLYREAERGESVVPWDDRTANAHLLDFWRAHPISASGKKALVIACGFGQDAEQIAAWGFSTTAFDISATAIKEVCRRFPNTPVKYVTADLLRPPPEWNGAFDFVFETNTLQALPAELRPQAVESIARFVKPGGLLLAIARGREEHEPLGDLPWPLTRAELDHFIQCGLVEQSFHVLSDADAPEVRRFRAAYTRPQ
jgi:SAM-dependent methyltransferase